jgi:hypothetical protein
MKKYLILIALISMLTPTMLKAQRTRQASCSNQVSDRWYLMPYGGIGAAWYSYNLNGTLMDNQGTSYETEKSSTMLTYDVGLMFLRRFDVLNLGIGLEWQGFNGSSSNGLTDSKVNLYYYKAYGRFEVPIFSSSFNDFGAYVNLGAVFPNNVSGDNPSVGYFIDLGLYYNLIINKSSSFFFGLGFQEGSFNSTIGQAISKHRQSDLKLTLGYRIWF